MIPRYSRKEMADVWSDAGRFGVWLEVELLVLEELGKKGLAPKDAASEVRKKAIIKPERIFEIESEVKHDVIAFVSQIAETAGPSAGYLHRGMTSSDLLDTAFAVQLKRSGELLVNDLDAVLSALKRRATEHKLTPCVGRTHGIHAEPTTFGIKLIGWFAELRRQRRRLIAAIEEISVGKIAGAVGTYTALPPDIESAVLAKLKLKPETVPTQIVQRDRHAAFFLSLAQIASSLEKFCVEIRHLQRTEVREVEEYFTSGQKGSSAMPHKRNPIHSENLCGLARLVRSYATAALENVVLWHERDISHSSTERVIAPDACIALDFMLHRFSGLVENLVVYPEQMKKNLELTRGIVFSGSLLTALVDSGVGRDEAYKLVQKHSMAAWEGGPALLDRVLGDAAVTAKVNEGKLREVFNLQRHLAHVDMIFERAVNS